MGTFYVAIKPGEKPLVQVGQRVKTGDVICIIEAMKLENEVVAPTAGTITEVAVSKGTAVQNGQLLVKIG